MTSNQKKALDRLWQAKITGGECWYPGCHKEGNEGHHTIKRRFLNTRWDVANGRGLCRGHHDWAERNPIAYEVLITEEIGLEAYEALRQKSLMVVKQFYDEIREDLK
jgi:hypothetical protein